MSRVNEANDFLSRLQYLYNLLLLRPVPYTNLTYGQVVTCVLYQSLVITALFISGGNPMDNYRRAGFIAAGQLPPVFLLATKNSLASVIGKSYEKV